MLKTLHRQLSFSFAARALLLVLAGILMGARADSGRSQSVGAPDPDAVCASCHRDIYQRYKRSSMARASGPAADGIIPADFLHPQSGVHYRIDERNGRVFLSYERSSPDPSRSLKGEEELLYYLGSGRRGRTFLSQREGYWFEIPINWYAKKGVWDMAPHYQQAREMPLTLPIDSSCLHCHASQVQPALPDARNHFAAAPFNAGGITCEGCHGNSKAHVAQGGHGPILNPDKLAVDRRDSICLQCHLEAEVSVNRAGHTLADFRPGQEVSDDVIRFVHRNAVGAGGRATSQWEALLQSACKRKSGDRLTCTTCHDPHSTPDPETSVAFYRSKCLACHTGPVFATEHHPEQPDCANCHMPRSDTRDIGHEQVTDHRIQIPGAAPQRATGASAASQELIPVRGVAGDRDFGIAYSQLALQGNRQAGVTAQRFLRAAEKGVAAASDADLHTQLGVLDQLSGDPLAALSEYRQALTSNPFDATARGDTALIDAKAGNQRSAVELWSAVFANDPAQQVAALNLAITECKLGDGPAAARVLQRMLLFSPDNRQARLFAAAIADRSEPCTPQ